MNQNTAKILKRIGAGTMVAGGMAGAGFAGHHIGKRHGALQMADMMENHFEQYNAAENQELARQAFIAGLLKGRGDKMDKTAYLSSIKSTAFNDEMDKIAAGGKAGIVETIARSFGSMAKLPKAVGKHYAAVKNNPGRLFRTREGQKILHLQRGEKYARTRSLNQLKGAAKDALPALGITGGGLALGALGTKELLD